MKRANDTNDTDESTPNDETPQFGRVCGSCGESYMAVTVTGPEGNDATRGCGCPVTVVPTGAHQDETETEEVSA